MVESEQNGAENVNELKNEAAGSEPDALKKRARDKEDDAEINGAKKKPRLEEDAAENGKADALNGEDKEDAESESNKQDVSRQASLVHSIFAQSIPAHGGEGGRSTFYANRLLAEIKRLRGQGNLLIKHCRFISL